LLTICLWGNGQRLVTKKQQPQKALITRAFWGFIAWTRLSRDEQVQQVLRQALLASWIS
jgi:hypothetical protein